MVDFWNTLDGQTFRSQLKNLSSNIAELNRNRENEEEKLAKQIYAQLVAIDFNQEVGMSYSDLKKKAIESAKAYFSE